MNVYDFCSAVDKKVKQDYGHEDGGSLCFNLIEQYGAVFMEQGEDDAARVVAQHLEQQ